RISQFCAREQKKPRPAVPDGAGNKQTPLEIKAKRKLQVANVVVLTCNLSEVGAGRVGSRAVPVRVVEGIECLGAELKSGAFGDRELLEQAEVNVVETRIVDQIANALLMVERAGRRLSEQLVTGSVRGGEPEVRVARVHG